MHFQPRRKKKEYSQADEHTAGPPCVLCCAVCAEFEMENRADSVGHSAVAGPVVRSREAWQVEPIRPGRSALIFPSIWVGGVEGCDRRSGQCNAGELVVKKKTDRHGLMD
jgi:hypothetical protein